MFWWTLLWVLACLTWTAASMRVGWNMRGNWEVNKFLSKTFPPPKDPPMGTRV